MTTPQSDLAVWLDLLKALLWPATTLVLAYTFRNQLMTLLDKLSKLKVGDAEFAFQAPSTDTPVKKQLVPADASVHGPGGFLTVAGIESVLRSNGVIQPKDTLRTSFPIFSTSRQRTWLAFTPSKVFCLLDDETTRSTGRLIQWALPREHASPINARQAKELTGLLDIGSRKNWLYSTTLFPTPDALLAEVRRALEPPEEEGEMEEDENR